MHSGPLKLGQRGLPALGTLELGGCLSREVPALQGVSAAARASPCLSTPTFADWCRELVSITAIPASSSGEELRWLLRVTTLWFEQVWRQDEMMLELPLGARGSLTLGQGLVWLQLGLCPGELGSPGCRVSVIPQVEIFTTGW